MRQFIRYAQIVPLFVAVLLVAGCDDDDDGSGPGGDTGDGGGDGGADIRIDPTPDLPDSTVDSTVDTDTGGDAVDEDAEADAADDGGGDAIGEDVEEDAEDAGEDGDAVSEDVADAGDDAADVTDASDVAEDGDAPPGEGVLIISELVDGNYTGQGPKWVELSNIGDGTLDLSEYTFGIYSSGGGVNLGGGSSNPIGTGTLVAGASYVLFYGATQGDAEALFGTVYDVEPDFYAGEFSFNGDDALALFLGTANGNGDDGLLVDVYGEPGTDGTGLAWEYTDTYAVREGDVDSPRDAFDIGEWEIGDIDDLDTTSLSAFETLTSPGEHP